jgi:glycosyltransferase involved in cell wall biosynthesis
VRILVLSEQWFPDYAGGTARVVRATAEGLATLGHDIVLIAPRCDPQPEREIANGVDIRRSLRRCFVPQTVTDVYETRRAISSLSDNRFDLVVSHHVACATAAESLRLECPRVLVFHASPFREARHRRSTGIPVTEQWRSLGVEPFLYMQERFALKRIDQILVLSRFSRDLVLESDPSTADRISIVGGGVDVCSFKPVTDRQGLRARLDVAPDAKLLLTARRLVSRMGLELLLEAFRELHVDDPLTRLVVIGDGELRTTLEEQRASLKLDTSVTFVGRVSEAALRDWYCAADVFVLPTVAYEGFGMVTAEALACGTPVVGTPVGATREVLAPFDDTLLATEASAGAVANALSDTLARASNDMRAACRQYAEDHLSWRNTITKWEDALLCLTSQVLAS